MKSMLVDYVSEFEKHLNVDLMNKVNDLPLVEFIKDSWTSLEVVPAIKIVDFDYTEHESEIDINKYIFKRDKKKKKKERFPYKYIKDNRSGLLTTHIEVTLDEIDPKTGEKHTHVYPIKKSMLIPLQDDDGYFFIKGQKYYMIWQLVEKSTYTTSSSVTLKSLMPVAVNRNIIDADETLMMNIGDDDKMNMQSTDCIDVTGTHYRLPYYTVHVFRKEIPVLLFYLSKGMMFTLNFLEVSQVINFIDKLPEELDDELIYFGISNRLIMTANRHLFNKYSYIQSIIGGFINISNNRTDMKSLEDQDFWIKRIANPNNLEKGYGILKFFNRLLDDTTKKILKIHEYHRQNIYTLLRWMMQEYNHLRMKENLDPYNKRLRCNETISSLLTFEFSKKLNRVISLGNKATIDNFKDLFKFSGDMDRNEMSPLNLSNCGKAYKLLTTNLLW